MAANILWLLYVMGLSSSLCRHYAFRVITVILVHWFLYIFSTEYKSGIFWGYFTPILYGFWDELDWKQPHKSAKFQNLYFLLFHPSVMLFLFCKMLICISFLWVGTKSEFIILTCWMHIFSLNTLIQVVFQQISAISYGFWVKLNCSKLVHNNVQLYMFLIFISFFFQWYF